MIDYSFIRLLPDFAKAKQIDDPSQSEICLTDQIQLHPEEVYVQITNVPGGISFDGDIAVYLVDEAENVLADVSDHIAIREFVSDDGQSQQIAFEIAYLGVDFGGQDVFFKFLKPTSGQAWYSNPVRVTAIGVKYTTRLDYWNYSSFEGISYGNAQVKQSIRLHGLYRSGRGNGSEKTSYSQVSRKQNSVIEIAARMLRKKVVPYKFEYLNDFIFDRVEVALFHDQVYLNGIRVTNKPVLAAAEYIGSTNFMETSFDAAPNDNDLYKDEFQIFTMLQLIQKAPLGTYTLATLPNAITGTFNKSVHTLIGGNIKVKNSSGTILATYTAPTISVSGASFTVSFFEGLITENGTYTIVMAPSTFKSDDNLDTFSGTSWTFKVITGYYDKNYYDSTKYLTN